MGKRKTRKNTSPIISSLIILLAIVGVVLLVVLPLISIKIEVLGQKMSIDLSGFGMIFGGSASSVTTIETSLGSLEPEKSTLDNIGVNTMALIGVILVLAGVVVEIVGGILLKSKVVKLIAGLALIAGGVMMFLIVPSSLDAVFAELKSVVGNLDLSELQKYTSLGSGAIAGAVCSLVAGCIGTLSALLDL